MPLTTALKSNAKSMRENGRHNAKITRPAEAAHREPLRSEDRQKVSPYRISLMFSAAYRRASRLLVNRSWARRSTAWSPLYLRYSNANAWLLRRFADVYRVNIHERQP
jgi:hypothetical protein